MAVAAAAAGWRSTSLQSEQGEPRTQVQVWKLEWEWSIEAWTEVQEPDAVAQKS